MSDRKLRSATKHIPDDNTTFVCACKGKSGHLSAIGCTSCRCLCCKNCILKRFDISSEKKYKNIIKNYLCSNCTHNEPPLKKRKIQSTTTADENETLSDSDELFEDENDYQEALSAFCDTMKIYVHSSIKLQEIERKYSEDIKNREIAISKINPAINSTNENNNEININSVSSDILKIIFLFSLGDPNLYDQTVLNLLKVCKYWREIIHSNKNDETFHELLWYGSVNKFGTFKNKFDWKHLVLIPGEYLKLMLNMNNIIDMSKEETIAYRQLIVPEYDPSNDYMLEYCHDTNIPLLLQILFKCPKIYSLSFSGWLCEDIFFFIGETQKCLRCLDFSYTTHGLSRWFGWLVGEENAVKDTLWNIHIERSHWCDDEAMYMLSHCKNLANVSSEKWHVSGDGLAYLFDGCSNLLSIRLDRYVDERGEWEKAFKSLAEKNKVIENIEFNDCKGFNDECLGYLMNPKSCPKLKELSINYHSCSAKMIKKFKKKRPDVNVYGEAIDF